MVRYIQYNLQWIVGHNENPRITMDTVGYTIYTTNYNQNWNIHYRICVQKISDLTVKQGSILGIKWR
jgi:hypothetical protein